MGDFSTTVLGLAAIGVAGFLAYKFILPKLDLSLDFLGPGDIEEEDSGPEPYPVYVPSPPQTIIEERLVPISQPPVYVYPPPTIIGGGIPPFPCPLGHYWNGWECERVDCPAHYRWKDGRCQPKDCHSDEFWNGRDCEKIDCHHDEFWNGRRCEKIPGYVHSDHNGGDRDSDRDRRRRRDYNRPSSSSSTPRPYKRPERPRTNITTLLTPKPKVEEEEKVVDTAEEKPKTSPVAALAGFTGRAYEYI